MLTGKCTKDDLLKRVDMIEYMAPKDHRVHYLRCLFILNLANCSCLGIQFTFNTESLKEPWRVCTVILTMQSMQHVERQLIEVLTRYYFSLSL